MLTRIMDRTSRWVDTHACQFEVKKFQLIHFLHPAALKTKPNHDIPLKIGDHVIRPSHSVKYLGVVIDRHLQWKEQIEAAVAKGMATVLAIARLSRHTVGMPRSMIRQLYRSVAVPRVKCGLVTWYEPIRSQEGSPRREG
jgi:hypothetical protein